MTTPLMVVVTWRVVVTVSVTSPPVESLLTVQTPEPTTSVIPSQVTVPVVAEMRE